MMRIFAHGPITVVLGGCVRLLLPNVFRVAGEDKSPIVLRSTALRLCKLNFGSVFNQPYLNTMVGYNNDIAKRTLHSLNQREGVLPSFFAVRPNSLCKYKNTKSFISRKFEHVIIREHYFIFRRFLLLNGGSALAGFHIVGVAAAPQRLPPLSQRLERRRQRHR